MNAKELAALLNGRQYPFDLTKEEEALAKENELVVVYGASDDLMEFRGAIREEFGAYEGTNAYLSRDGLLEHECRDERCPHEARKRKSAVTIEALWCPAGKAAGKEDHKLDGYCWEYKTAIQHETFEIMEGDDKYCKGIVFSIGALMVAWDLKNGKMPCS